MEKYLKRLCNAILDGRFKEEKYCSRKSYYGVEIQTQHLFASYGKIGYSVTVFSARVHDKLQKYTGTARNRRTD